MASDTWVTLDKRKIIFTYRKEKKNDFFGAKHVFVYLLKL